MASSLLAQTPAGSLEERVAALERQLLTLAAENRSLRERAEAAEAVREVPAPPVPAAVPAPAPRVATLGGNGKSLALGGYLHIQGEAGDAPDERFPAEDRFLVRRARLALRGAYSDDIGYLLQTEFGNGNLACNTNLRVQLMDAFVIWRPREQAQVTVGQFRAPYGAEQLQADTTLIFAERAQASDRLTLPRQVGAMVAGAVVDRRVNYAAAVFNGTNLNNGGNDNDNGLFVGRLGATVVERVGLKLTAGANAFTTRDRDATFDGTRRGRGLDVQLAAGRFEAMGEWLRTDRESITGADTSATGWAVGAAYRLIPQSLQLALRYETYDGARGGADSAGDVWTLAANCFLRGEDVKLAVNYLLGDPAGPLANQGRLLVRLQLVF